MGLIPSSENVVVITGATGGIGSAIARRFATADAHLVLVGRNLGRAAALMTELRPKAASVDVMVGDLRSDEFVATLADQVARRYGRIDVLILNAGAISFGNTWDITPEQFDEMMDLNVRAPWMCVRAVHEVLADGAAILVTSSVSASTHFPGETVYCMSKAALTPMVHGLALELAGRGIRVNAISPGVIGEAGMSHDAITANEDPDAELRANVANTPLSRLGRLNEIADSAAFLASDQASFITGVNLVVDGGLTVARVSSAAAGSVGQAPDTAGH